MEPSKEISKCSVVANTKNSTSLSYLIFTALLGEASGNIWSCSHTEVAHLCVSFLLCICLQRCFVLLVNFCLQLNPLFFMWPDDLGSLAEEVQMWQPDPASEVGMGMPVANLRGVALYRDFVCKFSSFSLLSWALPWTSLWALTCIFSFHFGFPGGLLLDWRFLMAPPLKSSIACCYPIKLTFFAWTSEFWLSPLSPLGWLLFFYWPSSSWSLLYPGPFPFLSRASLTESNRHSQLTWDCNLVQCYCLSWSSWGKP